MEIFNFEMTNWFLWQGGWGLISSNLSGIIASQELFSRSAIFFSFLVLFCSLSLTMYQIMHFSTAALSLQLYLAWWNLLQKVKDLKKNLQIGATESLKLEKFSLIYSFSGCRICKAHPFPIWILILAIPSDLTYICSCSEEDSSFLSASNPTPDSRVLSVERLEKTMMCCDGLYL